MNRCIACLLILCSSSGPALAVCRAPVVIRRPVVVKKEVAPVFLKFVAVVPLAELPTYSALYVPPAPVAQTPPTPAPPAPDLRPLLEAFDRMNRRLDRIEKRIEALEKGPAAPKNPAKPKDPFHPDGKEPTSAASPGADALKVARARCSSCHARGNEANGGDFVLLEAGGEAFAPLAEAARRSATAQLTKGRMPPAKSGLSLTPEESQALLGYFARKEE
jgi:mono/diheme cytochrome c family protein